MDPCSCKSSLIKIGRRGDFVPRFILVALIDVCSYYFEVFSKESHLNSE